MATPTIFTPWRSAWTLTPIAVATRKTINAAGGVLNYLLLRNAGQQSFGKVWVNDISVGYADKTTAAGDDTLADVPIFQNNSLAQGDEFYVGFASQFNAISFLLSTNGTVGSATWAYSQGAGVFAALTLDIDGTNNLRQTGVARFTPPGAWATDTVNGAAGLYWVRVKAVTAEYTVPPVATRVVPGLATPLVSVYLVPSAGSASVVNAIVANVPIPSDGLSHNVLKEGGIDFIDMNGSDFVQVVSDTLNQVYDTMGGVEYA